MTIPTTQLNAKSLPSNRSLWLFSAFNLTLLCLLSLWLWKQNQPVAMPNAILVNAKMQCVSYSPYYKKGVTPLKLDTFIPPEQMDQDLALAKLQLAGIAMTRRRKIEATNLLNEAKKLDKQNMLKDQIKMMKDQMKKM